MRDIKIGSRVILDTKETATVYRVKPEPDAAPQYDVVLSDGSTDALYAYEIVEVLPDEIVEVLPDPVTKPEHYTFGKYEVLDVILDWGLNFTRGSAVKYIARAGRKSKDTEAQDLRKAAQMLLREAEMLEGKNE